MVVCLERAPEFQMLVVISYTRKIDVLGCFNLQRILEECSGRHLVGEGNPGPLLLQILSRELVLQLGQHSPLDYLVPRLYIQGSKLTSFRLFEGVWVRIILLICE